MFRAISLCALRPVIQQIHLLELNLFHVIFLRGAAILIVVSTGGLLTIKLSLWIMYSEHYPDPFAVYESILPGKPSNNIKSYHCTIYESHVYDQRMGDAFACTIIPNDSHFDFIRVEGCNGEITLVIFYAADLSLGQVMLRWQPVSQPTLKYSDTDWKAYWFSADRYIWNQSNYPIQVYSNKTLYHRPVRIIGIKSISSTCQHTYSLLSPY